MDNKFGLYIKQNREAIRPKLSIRGLAELSNIHFSYLSRIEKGEFVPSRDLVVRLAYALNIDVNESLIKAGYVPNVDDIDILDQLQLKSAKTVDDYVKEKIDLKDKRDAEKYIKESSPLFWGKLENSSEKAQVFWDALLEELYREDFLDARRKNRETRQRNKDMRDKQQKG